MDHPAEWLLLIGTFGYVGALGLTLYRLARRSEPFHGANLVLILVGWLIQSAGLWSLWASGRCRRGKSATMTGFTWRTKAGGG